MRNPNEYLYREQTFDNGCTVFDTVAKPYHVFWAEQPDGTGAVGIILDGGEAVPAKTTSTPELAYKVASRLVLRCELADHAERHITGDTGHRLGTVTGS